MANLATSWVQVHPSFVMPEILLQYQQVSGAFDLFATGNPLVKLGPADLAVYLKVLDIRTKVNAGQSPGNALPSCTTTPRMISTPTYLFRTRAKYDHHEQAATDEWGYSTPQAQQLGMRQGVFQQLRTAALYGVNAANGEGLLNANGATTINLPPDSNGNTTVSTYDNGQMAFFLASLISSMKTRTMQLGAGNHFAFCMPQRIGGMFQYQNIVQVTQFQRTGAGSLSTSGVLREIMERNEDTLEWTYDDTLIGKGAGGTDAVIVTMPEVKRLKRGNLNTNTFAELTPGLDATTLMLMDMAAPREIPTPLPGGAVDVVSELRSTPGWAPRPEAVTIVSMQFQ